MTYDSLQEITSFGEVVRDAVLRTRAAERVLDQSGVLMWATTIPVSAKPDDDGDWRLDPIVVLRGGEVGSLSDGVFLGSMVDTLVGADSGYPKARRRILAGRDAHVSYLEHPQGLAHSDHPWLSRYTPVRDGGGRIVGIACTSMPFVDVESTAGMSTASFSLESETSCRCTKYGQADLRSAS